MGARRAVAVRDRADSWIRTYEPILQQAKQNATAALPALKNMKVAQTWGGVIDVTPDGVPVISPVESPPGFISRPVSQDMVSALVLVPVA